MAQADRSRERGDPEMTSRDRLIAAWSFQEPDRVPIELRLDPALHNLPQAGRIAEFVDNEADNFIAVPSAYWDFFGLPVTERSETLDPSPEGHRRVKHVFSTPVGDFHRITRHSPHVSDPSDFYWERRYVHTLDDLVRLAEAPRAPLRLAEDLYTDAVHRIGHRGLPVIELSHPLGLLVRWANTEAVYGWLVTDAPVIHKLLEAANRQVVEAVQAIGRTAMQPWFIVCAHEMLLPPWMGPRMFDEFVFPYDKAVNDAVHRIGGKVRAHCHGCCARFLGRMADMGLDGIEPLEPAPYGDVDLREGQTRCGRTHAALRQRAVAGFHADDSIRRGPSGPRGHTSRRVGRGDSPCAPPAARLVLATSPTRSKKIACCAT